MTIFRKQEGAFQWRKAPGEGEPQHPGGGISIRFAMVESARKLRLHKIAGREEMPSRYLDKGSAFAKRRVPRVLPSSKGSLIYNQSPSCLQKCTGQANRENRRRRNLAEAAVKECYR